jgi:hypothetical protein
MLQILRCLAASAVLATLAAPTAHAGLNDRKTLMLRGRTTDQEGFPVERVKILVVGRSLRLSTLSDDLGRYSIAIPLGTVEGLRREPLFFNVRAERRYWRMALPGGDSQLGLEVKVAVSPDGVVRCVARSNDARIAAAAARTLGIDGDGTGTVQINFLGIRGEPAGAPPAPALTQTAQAAVTGSPRPELAEAAPPSGPMPAAGVAPRSTSPPAATPSGAGDAPSSTSPDTRGQGARQRDPEAADLDAEQPQPPPTRESSTRNRDGETRSQSGAASRYVAGKRSVPARSTARKPAPRAARAAARTKAVPQANRPPHVSLSPLVSATPYASTPSSAAPKRPYPSDPKERARWELEARQQALARIKQENLLAQKMREEEARRRDREVRAAERASSTTSSGRRASSPASASPAAPRASSGARRAAPRLSSSGGSSSSAPRPGPPAGRGSAAAPDEARGPLAAAGPAAEETPDATARTPGSVIPAPENRARARARDLVVGSGVRSATAEDAQDCLCRVRGTIEVRSQRPLERRVSVSIALEQVRQASDAVELFMGSPREFELPRVPCGSYTLQVGMSPGRPALRVVSGDGSFRCVGVHQVRVILEPR